MGNIFYSHPRFVEQYKPSRSTIPVTGCVWTSINLVTSNMADIYVDYCTIGAPFSGIFKLQFVVNTFACYQAHSSVFIY